MANDQKGMAAARQVYDDRSKPTFRSLEAAITAYLAASTPAKTELVEHSFNARDLELAPEVLAKALELAVDRGGQTLPVSDYDISRAKVIINGENSEIASLREALTASQAEVASLREALEPFAEAADDLDDDHRDNSPIWECSAAMGIDAIHLRRARAAIEAGWVK